jgi:hypothetical protein
LPACALIGAAAASPGQLIKISGSIFGAALLAVCGLIRDRGRTVQDRLWKSWGGSPTLQRLRWRNANSQAVVARLHERIDKALKIHLPDAAAEAADPGDADAQYDEAIAALRQRTRDKARFPLVFEENVEYGFRRNALGIRPLALLIAVAVLAVSAVLLISGHGATTSRVSRWGVAAAVSVAALLYWWFAVTEDRMRRAAELYTDRLLEAVEDVRT